MEQFHTATEVEALLITAIEKYLLPIEGLRSNSRLYRDIGYMAHNAFGSLNLDYERSWGVNCHICIRLIKRSRFDRVYDWEFTTSWSATERSVTESLAAIKLYREITEALATVASIVGQRSLKLIGEKNETKT